MLALGENLARIRTARGLTQDDLAQASGVSVDTISRLERGARATARRSTLQALSLALGTLLMLVVSTASLVRGELLTARTG